MTFLAPWAMWLGVLVAGATVLLHLVARQRPAAYLLPTARFVPERQTLVSRAASRPRDLLLLLLRTILLLCAGAAFAQPVFTRAPHARARIVLVDRSAMVADPADAARRVRALASDGVRTVLVAFDTGAVAMRSAAPDSLPAASSATTGSVTAALVAARRLAGALALAADSVELVLVSPVAASELDAATWPVRALWPGAMRVERVAVRGDSMAATTLERAVPASDALGPALVHVSVSEKTGAVRIRRGAVDAADSAFARAGGTVVRWDSLGAAARAEGVVTGDDVVVAPVGRLRVPPGAIRARWADGTPAATEAVTGAGCIRTVGIVVPAAGDVALRPAVQRMIRALVVPCGTRRDATLADAAVLRRLGGGTAATPASALADGSRPASRIVPWLLGIALASALLELAVRRLAPREASA